MIRSFLHYLLVVSGIKRGSRINAKYIPASFKGKLKSHIHHESAPIWNIKSWSYEAILENDVGFKAIRFNILGNVKSVTSEVTLEDIPSNIINVLLRKYAGASLKKAYKVDSLRHHLFEIEMRKGFSVHHLLFSSDGNLKRNKTLKMIH